MRPLTPYEQAMADRKPPMSKKAKGRIQQTRKRRKRN